MSCCRGPSIVVPRPVLNTQPRPAYIEAARICNKIKFEGVNLVVTLQGNTAHVSYEGVSYELADFLSRASECPPEVKVIVHEISTVYSHAISSGTVQRIVATHGTPRVSINFLRNYR